MIYLKTNPLGIDIPIQKLQEKLHDGLNAKWNLGGSDYNCYGRAYRNQDKDKKYTPEVFTGGKDYYDPMTNDRKALTSFFGESANSEIMGLMSQTDVHIIFCIDLSAIKPNIQHRADEEAHIDILSIINANKHLGELLSTDIWMDSVFREYTSYRAQEAMLFNDMHPFHCFRVNIRMKYKNINC